MAEEWFRSPTWGPDGEAEFERHLARARRTSRGQYLRIKGLALREAGYVAEARSLWLRVLDDPGYESETWSALEHLGDLAFDDNPEESEFWYRRLLTENPTLNATTQLAEVRLAELLTRKGTTQALNEAGEMLTAWQENRHSPFPHAHFQWEVARARWGEAVGRPDVVRDSAKRAVELSHAGSPFSRHPGAGVVRADPGLLNWLHTKAGR